MKSKDFLKFIANRTQQAELEKLENRKKTQKRLENIETIDNDELITLLREVARVMAGKTAIEWNNQTNETEAEAKSLFDFVVNEIYERLECGLDCQIALSHK